MTITLKIGGATTGRKFTDPIRYFKANDPYYWEVDNIPLKQLQENVKYINDRLNTAIVSGNLDISRQDIAELKPYCNNNDDVVRVKPGRYTARINNAHNIDRLDLFVRQTNSIVIGNYTNYNWATNATLDALIDRIQSVVAEDALNLNGLSERAFAHLARNPDEVVDPGDEENHYPRTIWRLPSTIAATGSGGAGYHGDIFPISEYLGFMKYSWQFSSGSHKSYLDFLTTDQANGDPNRLLHLPILENALIKYWRGTARTAIVDVPTELDIQIPVFDEDDFPVASRASAASRIDLIFIYSKPVDTSAVTVGKYIDGPLGKERTKITEPILGVLKGAGLVLDPSRFGSSEGLMDSYGNSKMFASVADQNSTNNGFKVGINQNVAIHGSFPSPEDLLNIAPLLSEQLEEDSWFLTGQTIFPVAYVKVNKQPGVNVQGSQVITSDDIVDIRPLFRTAELTYNERAGIAAAMPPLSLANRAVGRYELEYEINALHQDHDTRLLRLEGEGITFSTEQTHYIPGASPRGGKEIWTTRLDGETRAWNTGLLKEAFRNKVGLKDFPKKYDLLDQNGIVHPAEDIISVFLTIEGKHLVNGDDGAFLDPPVIWVNSITSKDVGENRARADGMVSKYSDRPVMSQGVGATDARVRTNGGNKHSFELPVEFNAATGKLEIYFWAGGETYWDPYTEPKPDFAEYYWCQILGYKYRVHHAISLIN